MGRLCIITKISRKSRTQEKYQGQIFENLVGGPSLPGVPKFYKGVRVLERGRRGLSNGVKKFAQLVSYLELNVISKKNLNLIFSKLCVGIFLKFSGNVEGTTLYGPKNF